MPLRAHLLPIAGLVASAVVLLHPALGLYFWSGDDVFELPMAGLLLDGELGAWWAMSSGAGHTGTRILPRLLWAWDLALWGGDARGWYLTNALLHLGCMLAVYGLAWRTTGTRVAAFAGAAAFGFLGNTAQVVSFLSAREDSLATLLFAVIVGAWPTLRRRRGGAVVLAGLWAALALTKESGLVLPGVLLVVDFATLPRGEVLQPRRLLRDYGPLAVVLALVALLWWLTAAAGAAGYGALRSGGAAGGWSTSRLLANLAQGLLHPYGDHPGRPLGGLDAGLAWAVSALLIGGVLLALPRREARVGLVWTVLGLAPPAFLLGWGVEQSWGDGRYFHLASAGLGLVLACGVAVLPPRPRLAAALAVTLAFGLAFSSLVLTVWSPADHYTRDLADALDGAQATPDAEVHLAWPRLDPGAKLLLDGGFLRRLVDDLPSPLHVVVEGSEHRLTLERGSDPRVDRLQSTPADLDRLSPDRDVLIGPSWGPEDAPAFARIPLPLPAPRPGPGLHFDFAERAHGWTHAGGGALEIGPRGGLLFQASGALDYPGDPAPPDLLRRPELVSPPLGQDRFCGVEIDLRVRTRRGHAGPSPLQPHNFGLFAWGDERRGPGFDAAIPFGVADTDRNQTVRLDLRNSPSWRTRSRADRVGITPSALGGTVVVDAVRLLGCTPGP